MTTELPGAVRPEGPRVTVQAIFGLMVIAVGILFTLDNLEIIDAGDYWQYWPIGLVAIGVLKLYHAARGAHGWLGGLIFVSIGAWMLFARIVYFRIDLRELLPLFLVFLGGYMVWRGFGGRRTAGAGAGDGLSTFSALAIMGGVSRRSNTQNFRGADLTAIMGGCEIDLRNASIEPGEEAVIDVFAMWGGIDLRVPPDWTIVTRAVPIMGGIEDKTRPPAIAEKRLVLRGLLLMGGATVKN